MGQYMEGEISFSSVSIQRLSSNYLSEQLEKKLAKKVIHK